MKTLAISLVPNILFSKVRPWGNWNHCNFVFTPIGGITTDAHNDFYVEYWNPTEQRISKYFPDFLIETDKGRFLVVEVKSGSEKTEYEANKKRYDGTNTSLFNEVYAKELGFLDFQKVNKDFEYKIVFDAHLQERQRELFEMIKTL